MRRLGRKLFTICAAMSLLLCIALTALWVRSHWITDYVACIVGNDGAADQYAPTQLWTRPGAIVAHPEVIVPNPRPSGPKRWEYQRLLANTGSFLSMPAIYGFEGNYLGAYYTLRLWPLVLLTSLLPVLWVGLFIRGRTTRHVGSCTECGYDLRATPQRCPECGAVASTSRSPLPRRE